ncbi:uncharacterized protein LOC135146935 [Daucus carota subsp. sativus]|uniref:uncharacterized protein LOC135146935 n=1 Tax=Daucus carota subsp. sativus TaxID=79200 RepID=UPI003082C517
MDSGRKRIPLGVVSPSAVRNAQRRRPSHDVQTSGNVPSANRENLEPNRASASMPESSFQSPARNDNFVQQPSHSTLGSCTEKRRYVHPTEFNVQYRDTDTENSNPNIMISGSSRTK